MPQYLNNLNESIKLAFSLFSALCFCQDLLNEARQRLAAIAKDPAKYSTLLEGLVLQVPPITSLQLLSWDDTSNSSV